MSHLDTMKKHWEENFRRMAGKSKGFQKFANGTLTIEEYKAILREVFHNARENSQIMAMASFHFKGIQREIVQTLLRHAQQESGNEKLTRQDLEALGEDTSDMPFERPSPSSLALTGAITYLIQNKDPAALLGYIFHLEYTHVQMGGLYIEGLREMGVPETAMTFIAENTKVDVSHVMLIEEYTKKMIQTPEQLESVLYAMRVTSELYAKMVDDAVDSAGAETGRYGFDQHEVPVVLAH